MLQVLKLERENKLFMEFKSTDGTYNNENIKSHIYIFKKV